MNRLGSCLLIFLLAGASTAAAQTDPRLLAAVRSAQEGQGDSARSAVDRLLAATPPTDSLYPQILYTQAMVANTAADMRRHLQRVVVEHPTSPWVDDALLRLVQMDYATRSFESAARNLERLRLDYPGTQLFGQAAYWGGRTYIEMKDTTSACRWLADGITRAETDLELRRQLGFMYQRCDKRVATQGGGAGAQPAGGAADTAATPRTATPDSAKAVTPGPAAKPGPADSAARRVADSLPTRPAAPTTRFRVQVAAVATPGAADDAAGKAEELGFPAVIVRERGLYKVRVGEFATRQEALAAVPKLKSKIGGNPFVVAVP
jgi:TolA-binding protein